MLRDLHSARVRALVQFVLAKIYGFSEAALKTIFVTLRLVVLYPNFCFGAEYELVQFIADFAVRFVTPKTAKTDVDRSAWLAKYLAQVFTD
jgi:hypothetical protein